MVHEPTIGELSRGIQRLEEQVKALGAVFARFATTF